jgi:hypothetical protein
MASQSILEIIIQAVDESAAALEGATTNLKQVSEAAVSAGVQIGIAGAALTAAYAGVVSVAAGVQESQDNLKQAVTDAMKIAGDSTGSYATQVQFLKDKIDGYKASIAQAQAILDTHTGSVEKSAAAHAKAAADVAADQANIAKYQQQLDLLQNAENLRGQSTDEITSKLESQATANVSLGFSLEDSTRSLSQAFTATKSVTEAMQVNQAAMDLARAKNLDLATATNQVILAMNGQGRALATYGIQIKDGLSGMEALSAVNGQSQAYAATLSGQLAVAMASFNKLLSDMGSTQLPILTRLLEFIVKIIDAVDAWTTQHPKLTAAILAFVAALGVTLTVLGALLVVAGTVGLALAAGLSTVFVGIAAAVAVAVAAIVALGVAIVENWDYIRDNFVAVWTILKTVVSQAMTWIANFVGSTNSTIQGAWNAVWTAIGNFFTGIWDGIKNSVTSAISFVQTAVSNFVSWAQSILGPILAPINAIGSAVSSFGHAVGGAVSAVFPKLATGGIVSSPTLALVGEAGPEAVIPLSAFEGGLSLAGRGGGGGGNIIVNINGGNYLDSGGARMIADELAKNVVRQIKVRNYAV